MARPMRRQQPRQASLVCRRTDRPPGSTSGFHEPGPDRDMQDFWLVPAAATVAAEGTVGVRLRSGVLALAGNGACLSLRPTRRRRRRTTWSRRRSCGGKLAADHERVWARHQTITDPAPGRGAAAAGRPPPAGKGKADMGVVEPQSPCGRPHRIPTSTRPPPMAPTRTPRTERHYPAQDGTAANMALLALERLYAGRTG